MTTHNVYRFWLRNENIEYEDRQLAYGTVNEDDMYKFTLMMKENWINMYGPYGIEFSTELIIKNMPSNLIDFENHWTFNKLLNFIVNYIMEDIFYDEKVKYKKRCAKRISNWWLNCKYDPQYKVCRDRVDSDYNECYLVTRTLK